MQNLRPKRSLEWRQGVHHGTEETTMHPWDIEEEHYGSTKQQSVSSAELQAGLGVSIQTVSSFPH